jgi:hypothetical protein
MRLHKIPFSTVILACVLPWIAAFLDSKLLTLLPDIVLFSIVLIALIFTQRGLPFISRGISIMMVLVLFHTLIVVYDGRGVGSGGSLLLMLEIYCFVYLLKFNGEISSVERLHSQVTFVYKLHLAFLVFELIARLLGALDFFVAVAGNAESVMVYKTYNTAALLQYFGMSGLNSLLLGSQTASQLILFASIWFFPFYRRLNGIWGRHAYLSWFLVAMIFYPFSATMTVNIILLIYVFFFIFVNKDTFLSKNYYRSLLGIIILFFIEQVVELLAFRINEADDIEIYMHAYTHLVEVFEDIPLHNYVLGWGADIEGRPVEDSNFGIGMIFFQAGFLFVMPFVLFFYYIYKYYAKIAKTFDAQSISSLSSINAFAMLNGLLAIGWGVSLIHYTPAIELGGRHIFALHVAIVIHLTRILECSRMLPTNRSRQL